MNGLTELLKAYGLYRKTTDNAFEEWGKILEIIKINPDNGGTKDLEEYLFASDGHIRIENSELFKEKMGVPSLMEKGGEWIWEMLNISYDAYGRKGGMYSVYFNRFTESEELVEKMMESDDGFASKYKMVKMFSSIDATVLFEKKCEEILYQIRSNIENSKEHKEFQKVLKDWCKIEFINQLNGVR